MHSLRFFVVVFVTFFLLYFMLLYNNKTKFLYFLFITKKLFIPRPPKKKQTTKPSKKSNMLQHIRCFRCFCTCYTLQWQQHNLHSTPVSWTKPPSQPTFSMHCYYFVAKLTRTTASATTRTITMWHLKTKNDVKGCRETLTHTLRNSQR